MPKAKDGPALFELIERQRKNEPDALKVPSWWNHAGSKAADFQDGEMEPAELEIAPTVAVPVAATSEPGKKHGLVEIEGQCVRFTLTSTTGAVVVFVMMMTLVFSHVLGTRSGKAQGLREGYELGRSSFAAEATSEIELAKAGPAATSLLGSLVSDPMAAAENEAIVSQAQWVKGLTYIVAQEFSSGRNEDALLARQFLGKRGIETELVLTKSGATQLITTRGYNHKDRVQKQMADALLEKVRAAGGEYFTVGGGYKLNGYYRTLTRDSWLAGA